MEREFLPCLTAQQVSPLPCHFAPIDESTFNSVFSETTLQTLFPLPPDFSFPSPNFTFFTEHLPAALTHKHQQLFQLPDLSFYSNPPPTSLNFDSALTTTDSIHLLDFLSKHTDLCCDSKTETTFNQLSDLRTLEQAQLVRSSSSSSTRQKRARFGYAPAKPETLDSIVQSSFNFQSYIFAPPANPQGELARRRRQRISDKTRSLQKLMPWDKKMDTATLLEEAYKYVQFLQAQIKALQSMPVDSSFGVRARYDSGDNGLGSLGKLNRQQLLQVMTNSPAVQTMLCSQGLCVFSYEQLVFLRRIVQKKALLQQVLLDPSKTC